jgi:hypothetical protein
MDMPAALSTNASEAAEQQPTPPATDDPLVQYVVLRSDLWSKEKWPLGSVAAQACHAATAAMWMFREDAHTLAYCSDIDRMRKARQGSHMRAPWGHCIFPSQGYACLPACLPACLFVRSLCGVRFTRETNTPCWCNMQVVLEVKDEAALRSLSEKLTDAGSSSVCSP